MTYATEEVIMADGTQPYVNGPQATALPSTKPPFQVPAELVSHSRYRIMQALGAGGMGVVYKAEHRMMERVVALKVINRNLTAKARAVERFHVEVRAAAKLDHPNIVRAFDADQ